ncbi:MAG: low molecular weight protein-tyrosine-phosphatase [Phycisphaerales bacterium]
MAESTASPTRILFVCMGNICRSPVAEGVFLHLARETGQAERFVVDSAGTGGWHAGELPDKRSIAVARRHGIELPSRARQVVAADFVRFDHLVVMDDQNRRDLYDMGAPRSKVSMLMAYHANPPRADVPDPYQGGPDGFDLMYALIDGACRGLLERLARA